MATAILFVELELLGLRERARLISERIKKLSEHLRTEQVELEEAVAVYNRIRARLLPDSIIKENNLSFLGVGSNGELLEHEIESVPLSK